MDAGVLDNNLKTWRCFANDGLGMLPMLQMLLIKRYFMILKKINFIWYMAHGQEGSLF